MREGRSFLEDKSKVTGITDVLSRMGATEAVDHEAKVTSDDQARSLLNRFLGAQVLMSGVESMMASSSLAETARVDTDGNASGDQATHGVTTTTTTSTSTRGSSELTHHHHRAGATSTPSTTTTTTTVITSSKGVEPVVVSGVDINEVTDEAKLNQLLDTCGEYEERRKIRMRLKSLMAEKKGDKGTVSPFGTSTELRSAQGSSTQKSFSSSFSTSSTSSSTRASQFSKTESKTVSPFEKFKKLDSKQSPRPAKE